MSNRTPAMTLLAGTLALLAPHLALAAGDDLLGTWVTAGGNARVEIQRCGPAFCGEIVWMAQPLHPPGSREGTPGEPKVDLHNPDKALAGRPLLGMRILAGFEYRAAEASWNDGTVYDPEDGRTYRGRLRLLDRDRLELRGFVGLPLFGRSVEWTRAPAAAAAAPAGPAPAWPSGR